MVGSAVAVTATGESLLPTLLRWLPISLALVACWRLGAHAAIRRQRSRGADLRPTVVIGAGAVGQRVARTMLEQPRHGLLPIGFVDSVPDSDLARFSETVHAYEDRHRVPAGMTGLAPSAQFQPLRVTTRAIVQENHPSRDW